MRKFKLIALVTLIIFGFQFNSCDLINPSEQIPAYLFIDSFQLDANTDTFGSLSKSITDVWVIVDNQFIGTFELPCTIPVLMEGTHLVTLRAGIKENGISNTRMVYPFYSVFQKSVNFVSKNVDTIKPEITYISEGVNIKFIEDFESFQSYFKKSTLSTTDFNLTNVDSLVFEGDNSMIVELDSTHFFFEMENGNLYNLPRNQATFLEFNFRSDIPVKVGYVAFDPVTQNKYQHLLITLNPSSEWKKMYVNVGNEVQFEPANLIFKIFIGAVKPDKTGKSRIQFDNIKLISFE